MTNPVSEVVEEDVIVPAVLTVTPKRSFVPDGAFHPVEHRLRIPGRISAAADGLFNRKPPYGPQECWNKAEEPT